jgi:hypothetical protein
MGKEFIIMFFIPCFRARPSWRPRAWLAGACFLLNAACGGERSEPAASPPPAVQAQAAHNAEGELVQLQVAAGAKPQAVAVGQACGAAVEGGRQPVCEAGSYCLKASGAGNATCVAAPGAPRSEE